MSQQFKKSFFPFYHPCAIIIMTYYKQEEKRSFSFGSFTAWAALRAPKRMLRIR